MKEQNKIDLKKIAEQVNDIYQKVLNETIELLKNCKNGRYIGSYENSCCAFTDDGKIIKIHGVGLNDKNHICIKAHEIDEEGDYDWIDIMSDNKLNTWVYPELYRFVAENIDSATTQLKASMIADNYKGVKLCNNEEEFYDDIHFDDWINGCTQVFLDEHDITLEEYAEIMYKKKNKVCFNCWNCEYCKDCEDCTDGCDCFDCDGCKECTKCEQCGNCDECYECDNCSNCENCNRCSLCGECNNCESCENCENCIECKYCRYCKECWSCLSCEFCGNCENCDRCRTCVECKNCKYCHNCENCRACESCELCKNCKDCKEFCQVREKEGDCHACKNSFDCKLGYKDDEKNKNQ